MDLVTTCIATLKFFLLLFSFATVSLKQAALDLPWKRGRSSPPGVGNSEISDGRTEASMRV